MPIMGWILMKIFSFTSLFFINHMCLQVRFYSHPKPSPLVMYDSMISSGQPAVSHLYKLSEVTVTKSTQTWLGGDKCYSLTAPEARSQKSLLLSWNWVVVGLTSLPQGVLGRIPCLFQLLVSAGVPWLMATSLCLCFPSSMSQAFLCEDPSNFVRFTWINLTNLSISRSLTELYWHSIFFFF